MRQLYNLEFYTWCNGDEMHTCQIGIFSTREEAEVTAQRYLKEVKGFCEYYCEYAVRETPLIGARTDVTRVWTYEGWDETEDIYETNILNGPFYTTRAAAREAMTAAKETNKRQHWLVLDHTIGKCAWAEGFIRDYDSGEIVPTLAELRVGLRSCADSRKLCAVEFEYADENFYLFPAVVGERLFLAAEEDDFILDGFTVRRIRDIYDLSDRMGIYQQIFEAEGLTKFGIPEVDVSDWNGVFASLQQLGENVIVEREYEETFFYIGRIEEVGADYVLLRHFDADGVWAEEPIAVLYRDITSVTFGSRFLKVFSRYV